MNHVESTLKLLRFSLYLQSIFSVAPCLSFQISRSFTIEIISTRILQEIHQFSNFQTIALPFSKEPLFILALPSLIVYQIILNVFSPKLHLKNYSFNIWIHMAFTAYGSFLLWLRGGPRSPLGVLKCSVTAQML